MEIFLTIAQKKEKNKMKKRIGRTYKINLETCIFVEADSEDNAMEVAEEYLNLKTKSNRRNKK